MKLTISDGPGDGSIDIHIKSDDCEVLINVKPEKISYYGDNYKENCIRGKINSFDDFMKLVTWLDEIKLEKRRQAQIAMEGKKP